MKKNFENLIIKSFPGNEFKIFNYELKINLSLADRIFSKFGISSDNFVIVNVNAGDLSLERRWPRKNFVKLIKWLIEKYKIQVVLIGTDAEKKYVEMVEKEVDSAYVKNLSGKINLEELIVLLKKTKFFITNDSGPLHLAVKLGCKTISFFGPETPILYGPLNKEHIVFFKNIDCSPCINVHTGKMVKCPHINPPCLSKIEVEEVKQKIEFSGWI